MTKPKYREGLIVRRKTKNGTPIGPYMTIQHVENDRIYADIIGQDTPNEMILKENVYLHKTNSVCISEGLLERLKNGTAICVQHETTPKWTKIWEQQPELIAFYTVLRGYRAVFVVESVKKTLSLGKPMIRIIVSNYVV